MTVVEVIVAVVAAEVVCVAFFLCLARSADAGDQMAELEPVVGPGGLRQQLRVVLAEDPIELGTVAGVQRLDQPVDPGCHHEQVPRRG